MCSDELDQAFDSLPERPESPASLTPSGRNGPATRGSSCGGGIVYMLNVCCGYEESWSIRNLVNTIARAHEASFFRPQRICGEDCCVGLSPFRWRSVPHCCSQVRSENSFWRGCTSSSSSKCGSLLDPACVRVRTNRREEVEATASDLRLRLNRTQTRLDSTQHKLKLQEKEALLAKQRAYVAESALEDHERQVQSELKQALRELEKELTEEKKEKSEVIGERDDLLRKLEALNRPWWYTFVQCRSTLTTCSCLSFLCPSISRVQGLLFRNLQTVNRPRSRAETVVLKTLPERQRSISNASELLADQGDANPLNHAQRRTELINALIAAEWEYISRWFENQMRNNVEPLLQENLAATCPGVTVKIGHTCNLGDRPVQLHGIASEKVTEAMPDRGETIENMQIVGEIDCLCNGIVDVYISGDIFGLDIGNLIVAGLRLRGVIMIELVKLTHAPPWFSGVRISFPNAPKVEINLSAKLGGLEVTKVTEMIKLKIIQSTVNVMKRSAVLPNRICISLSERMEDLSLRHPRPQGVLRLALLRAQGLPNMNNGSSWWFYSKGSAKEDRVDPYALITLGSESCQTKTCEKTLSPEWGENEVHDFFVTDLDKQSLCITVRDQDYGGMLNSKATDFLGRAEVRVAQLAGNQQQAGRPKEIWCPLKSETGWLPRGWVCLRAQWRPFAQVNEISKTWTEQSNWWSLGTKNDPRWLLAADVFYASGLPQIGHGTEHWASLTVFRPGDQPSEPDAPVIKDKDTPVAVAYGPDEHGLMVLNNIGLAPEVMTVEDRKQLGRKLWRKKVSLGEAATELERNGRRFVDVVWNCPVLMLVDKVQGVKVKVSVWRPARGRTRPEDSSKAGKILVGSVEHTLTFQQCSDRMISDLHLPLQEDKSISLKFRFQASPLLAPTIASSAMRRSALWELGQAALGEAAAGFCANRTSVEATASAVPINFAPTETAALVEGSEEEADTARGNAALEPTGPVSRSWFSWAWFSRAPAAAATQDDGQASDAAQPMSGSADAPASVAEETPEEKADQQTEEPSPLTRAERLRIWWNTPKNPEKSLQPEVDQSETVQPVDVGQSEACLSETSKWQRFWWSSPKSTGTSSVAVDSATSELQTSSEVQSDDKVEHIKEDQVQQREGEEANSSPLTNTSEQASSSTTSRLRFFSLSWMGRGQAAQGTEKGEEMEKKSWSAPELTGLPGAVAEEAESPARDDSSSSLMECTSPSQEGGESPAEKFRRQRSRSLSDGHKMPRVLSDSSLPMEQDDVPPLAELINTTQTDQATSNKPDLKIAPSRWLPLFRRARSPNDECPKLASTAPSSPVRVKAACDDCQLPEAPEPIIGDAIVDALSAPACTTQQHDTAKSPNPEIVDSESVSQVTHDGPDLEEGMTSTDGGITDEDLHVMVPDVPGEADHAVDPGTPDLEDVALPSVADGDTTPRMTTSADECRSFETKSPVKAVLGYMWWNFRGPKT